MYFAVCPSSASSGNSCSSCGSRCSTRSNSFTGVAVALARSAVDFKRTTLDDINLKDAAENLKTLPAAPPMLPAAAQPPQQQRRANKSGNIGGAAPAGTPAKLAYTRLDNICWAACQVNIVEAWRNCFYPAHPPLSWLARLSLCQCQATLRSLQLGRGRLATVNGGLSVLRPRARRLGFHDILRPLPLSMSVPGGDCSRNPRGHSCWFCEGEHTQVM